MVFKPIIYQIFAGRGCGGAVPAWTVLVVIPISDSQITLTTWHGRRVSYIYREGTLNVLIRAGYTQISLRIIQNILLRIFHPGLPGVECAVSDGSPMFESRLFI